MESENILWHLTTWNFINIELTQQRNRLKSMRKDFFYWVALKFPIKPTFPRGKNKQTRTIIKIVITLKTLFNCTQIVVIIIIAKSTVHTLMIIKIIIIQYNIILFIYIALYQNWLKRKSTRDDRVNANGYKYIIKPYPHKLAQTHFIQR